MSGIDQRVLCAENVVRIVPLNGLRQKWQADQEDNSEQNEET
jgi:hypothetical protein